MKSFFNHQKYFIPIVWLSLFLYPEIINAAEILYEQGWIYSYAHRVATPTAIYKGEGQLPLLLATVIAPAENNVFSDFKIKFEMASSHQTQVKIYYKGVEDRWWINLENQNRITIDVEEKAACIYFNRKKEGIVKEEFNAKF